MVVNILDKLGRKTLCFLGRCCMLCQKAKKDLDHILWTCDLAGIVWESFFKRFGMMSSCHKDVSTMIEESLLNLPFGERPLSLACQCECGVMDIVGWEE